MPKHLAPFACVMPRAISWIMDINLDRSIRFSASAFGKPRSVNTFPLLRSNFARTFIAALSGGLRSFRKVDSATPIQIHATEILSYEYVQVNQPDDFAINRYVNTHGASHVL